MALRHLMRSGSYFLRSSQSSSVVTNSSPLAPAAAGSSQSRGFSTTNLGGIPGSSGHVETDAQEGPTVEAESVESPDAERTKLLVLGGNGFVGSAVCAEAVRLGLDVMSLNRSGPPGVKEEWVEHVDWIRGSLSDGDRWRGLLPEVTAVVSCVGGFGSNDFMRKLNGDANVAAVNLAADEGVSRFVYISAHDVGLPSFVLRGYYEGKRAAEGAVRERFPYGGVILRPAMIYGTRHMGSISIPLGIIGAPLDKLLSNAKWASNLPLVGPALAPPISVTTVAKAAVRGAVDNAVAPGVLDVWGISRFG